MFGLSLINIMWSVPEIVANQIAPVMLKGRPLPVCIGFTTSVVNFLKIDYQLEKEINTNWNSLHEWSLRAGLGGYYNPALHLTSVSCFIL